RFHDIRWKTRRELREDSEMAHPTVVLLWWTVEEIQKQMNQERIPDCLGKGWAASCQGAVTMHPEVATKMVSIKSKMFDGDTQFGFVVCHVPSICCRRDLQNVVDRPKQALIDRHVRFV